MWDALNLSMFELEQRSIIADHGVRSVIQTQKNQILNKNKEFVACDSLIYDHHDNSGKTTKCSLFTS